MSRKFDGYGIYTREFLPKFILYEFDRRRVIFRPWLNTNNLRLELGMALKIYKTYSKKKQWLTKTVLGKTLLP